MPYSPVPQHSLPFALCCFQFMLESLKAKLDGKEAGWAEEQKFFPPDPGSDPWPGCPAVMGAEPLGSSRAAGTVQGWGRIRD